MPMPRKPSEQERIVKSTNQCVESIKMGFLMGASVGATFGTCVMLLVLVPRKLKTNLLLKYTASNAMKMGLMFGCFMGVGGALRCDDDDNIEINNNNNNNNKPSIFNYNKDQYNITNFNNNINKTKF